MELGAKWAGVTEYFRRQLGNVSAKLMPTHKAFYCLLDVITPDCKSESDTRPQQLETSV